MVSESFKLDGKIALVAGDSEFWSKYVVAALANAGADIAVAAKNPNKLNGAVSEAKKLGRKAIAIPTDTLQVSQATNMVEQVVKEFGRIDILVNASDLRFAKPAIDIKDYEWQRVMDANLTSVFHCCQAVGRQMIQQKKGRIINLISCLAERGMENGSAYCASMGGILQLTRALDLEWAPSGITVNAIGAGWISESEKTGQAQEELLLKYLPMKRYGSPEEVGSLVVYLASDTTGFYTGQFIHVDGAAMSHL